MSSVSPRCTLIKLMLTWTLDESCMQLWNNSPFVLATMYQVHGSSCCRNKFYADMNTWHYLASSSDATLPWSRPVRAQWCERPCCRNKFYADTRTPNIILNATLAQLSVRLGHYALSGVTVRAVEIKFTLTWHAPLCINFHSARPVWRKAQKQLWRRLLKSNDLRLIKSWFYTIWCNVNWKQIWLIAHIFIKAYIQPLDLTSLISKLCPLEFRRCLILMSIKALHIKSCPICLTLHSSEEWDSNNYQKVPVLIWHEVQKCVQ
jgi:hypothetical protein